MPTGKALYDELLRVDFDGLSGRIRFTEKGDRDPTLFVYRLMNWDKNGDIQMIGSFNTRLNEITFTESAYFRKGSESKPEEITPPVHSKEYLHEGLKILGYVELALLNLFSILCYGWMLVNRKHKAVIAAQRPFLNLLVLGCIIASWTILPLTVDEATETIDPNVSCMVAPWLFSLGFMLSVLALLGKKIRLWSIFRNPVGTRLRIGIRKSVALSGIIFVLFVNVIFLTLWTLINPLIWRRIVRVADKHDFPLLSYGACTPRNEDNIGTGYAFVITLIVLHLAAVIALGILNSKIRKMPEEFQEAKYIALLFTAILQLYLLAIPVFIAAFASPSARFMVLSTFVFFTCFFFLFFVFVPKMEQVRRNLMFRNWQLQQDSRDGVKHSTSGLEVDFVEGVRNNYVREKFLKFAERNLVIESYFFYMDVECFKANPIAADTGKLDVQKARDIYNCYIREGGLLQINVSASTREQVTRAYQSFAATKKTGDAVKEAMAQINSNMSDDLRKEFTMIFDPAQEEIG
jgi:hypothetical protein